MEDEEEEEVILKPKKRSQYVIVYFALFKRATFCRALLRQHVHTNREQVCLAEEKFHKMGIYWTASDWGCCIGAFSLLDSHLPNRFQFNANEFYRFCLEK